MVEPEHRLACLPPFSAPRIVAPQAPAAAASRSERLTGTGVLPPGEVAEQLEPPEATARPVGTGRLP